MNNCDVSHDICCCKNVLYLDKLCANCAKICWLKSSKIRADEINANEACIQNVDAASINTQTEVANDICAQKITAKQAYSDSSFANNLCAVSGTINNLCVDNLQVKNQMLCNKYRATAVLSSDLMYTLGDPIDWDVVLDDPNGNISTSPFKYTVPKTGYYQISFHVDAHGLSGASLISGIPVAAMEIQVNGVEFRDGLTPFLSFSDKQTAILSSLILLNAGDFVTTDLKVRVMDPVLGLVNYVGTMIIEGDGTFPTQSSFGIILLSELCEDEEQPITCTQCPVVTVPCQPFTIPCTPVIPPSCDPCDAPGDMNNATAKAGASCLKSHVNVE